MDVATEESQDGNLALFNKKLYKLLNKTRIQDGTYTLIPLSTISRTHLTSTLVLPTLLQDIASRADKWGGDGNAGRIDPFTEIYDVSLVGARAS